jgi:hypothetical protein
VTKEILYNSRKRPLSRTIKDVHLFWQRWLDVLGAIVLAQCAEIVVCIIENSSGIAHIAEDGTLRTTLQTAGA